jgi:hypothetical protein
MHPNKEASCKQIELRHNSKDDLFILCEKVVTELWLSYDWPKFFKEPASNALPFNLYMHSGIETIRVEKPLRDTELQGLRESRQSHTWLIHF